MIYSLVMAILTIASAIASIMAAYFAWSQMQKQEKRWRLEDARSSPSVYVALGTSETNEGWKHAVWQVSSRAKYPLDLLRIEFIEPKTIEVAKLMPGTDGPVELMKPHEIGESLEINQSMPEFSGRDPINIGGNFLWRLSDTSTPPSESKLRVIFIETNWPSRVHSKIHFVNIPH